MSYDASAIRVLKGLEGVRHRPAMYIGGTGVEGYHHLFKEILDNAVDEALAGYATEILVRLNEDGSSPWRTTAAASPWTSCPRRKARRGGHLHHPPLRGQV